MTEAEKKETLDRIEAAEKELAELKAKVQSCNEEVPDALEWYAAEKCWCVLSNGNVDWYVVCDESNDIIKHRRVFKTEKYAQMYREKTQFIADLLHFKWLYDRDYEQGEDLQCAKWTIILDDDHKFEVASNWNAQPGDIYFSTKELAHKCADWLNRKAGII